MASSATKGCAGCLGIPLAVLGGLIVLSMVAGVISSMRESRQQAERARIEARMIEVEQPIRHLCQFDDDPSGPNTSTKVRVLPGTADEKIARKPVTKRDGFCEKHRTEKVRLRHVVIRQCPGCKEDQREKVGKTETVARGNLPTLTTSKDHKTYTVIDGTVDDKAACGKLCRCRMERGWDQRTCEAVAKGRVFIGMTEEQARAAWGKPGHVNRTTNKYSVHEQWVYGQYGERGYLYFDDGVLRTIQN